MQTVGDPASSGSGAPGGVFTPTLFVGAALGSIIGQLFGLWPGMDTAVPLLLALTGMATLLAATTHAPIMAALMVFEMTGEYALLPGILLVRDRHHRVARPAAGVGVSLGAAAQTRGLELALLQDFPELRALQVLGFRAINQWCSPSRT